MLNLWTLTIVAERHDDFSYSIACLDEDGVPLSVEDWKSHVFLWHESSYFGTDVLVHDEFQEVVLSPYMAVEFLAKRSVNSFLNVRWDEDLDEDSKVAEVIWDVIQRGAFMPDFAAYVKGEFGWKPVDEEIDREWFSAVVNDLIHRNPLVLEAWEEVLREHPVFANFKGRFLDEQDFLEKIVWSVLDLPFTIGLRLNEPDFDGDDWKLELFLREQDSVYFYEGEKSLPARWKKYVSVIEREQKRFSEIIPWLSFHSGITLLSEDEAWRFLTEASETLVEMGMEILLPSWWNVVKESKFLLKAKMSSSARGPSFVGMNQVMDFDWRFSTNGVELTEEEFWKLVDDNRRLVQFRGQWIKLDPKLIEQMKKVLKRAEKEGLQVIDILEQELVEREVDEAEDELRAFANIQIELNEQMKAIVEQMKEITRIPEVEVPRAFQGALREYQQQGVNWLVFLRRFGFGACLADDMGLGKTIQVIAYFQYVKEHEKPEAPMLIIAPTSVLGNWQKELEKFAPNLNVKLHYGSNRKKGDDFAQFVKDCDVVLTSYGLSHGDFDELSSVTWSTLCLDEAQNIKNAHTKQSRAIRKLKG